VRDRTWQVVRVNELVGGGLLAINDGYRMKNEELGPAGIPFVRGGDIQDGVVRTQVQDHIRPEFAARLDSKLVRPGDVAFITKGTVGRVGRVLAGQTPFVVAPQVCYWRTLDPSRLDPIFLYYLIVGSEFQNQLDAVKTHGSMVADYVSLSDQRTFRLSLPPPEDQKAIASILGVLDDKIELNRRMNETLEAMAQALFKSWFIDFDPVRAKMAGRPPAGMDDATAALFPSGLAGSPLDETPVGWSTTTLEQVTSKIGSGATPRGGDRAYVEQGITFIRSQNVYDSEFVWSGIVRITDADAEQLRGVTVQPEDVLLNITGASILRTCVVDQSALPARVNQHVAIVRAKPGVPAQFLHFHLLRPQTKAYLLGMDAGASRQAVTKAHIESVPLTLPTPEVLQRFAQVCEPFFGAVANNREQTRTLASLREALIPKLLSGELRIRDAKHVVEKVA